MRTIPLLVVMSVAVTGCLGRSGKSSADVGKLRFPVAAAPATPIELPVPLANEQTDTTDATLWDPGRDARKVRRSGILFLSGVDGGFVEPADGIYTQIAQELSQQGVTSLFVRYRAPGEIAPSTQDALAGIAYLKTLGIQKIAIAAWSFGGAVSVHAAARTAETVAVLGFSPQSALTEPVTGLNANCSLLLFHSRDDENVAFSSSEQILELAPAFIRKKLIALEHFQHQLQGAGSILLPLALEWLETAFDFRTQGELGTGWMGTHQRLIESSAFTYGPLIDVTSGTNVPLD